jgi:hypothetical protein
MINNNYSLKNILNLNNSSNNLIGGGSCSSEQYFNIKKSNNYDLKNLSDLLGGNINNYEITTDSMTISDVDSIFSGGSESNQNKDSSSSSSISASSGSSSISESSGSSSISESSGSSVSDSSSVSQEGGKIKRRNNNARKNHVTKHKKHFFEDSDLNLDVSSDSDISSLSSLSSSSSSF